MNPKRLEMYNFLSHEQSVIDFNKFEAALILGAYNNSLDESNGAGKCIAPNTIITNAITGERISIKDLYNTKKEFYVFGVDNNLRLSPTKVLAVARSGKKSLFKIRTSNGREEVVSSTHPIYTSNMKCVEAQELKVGDFIAQPRIMPVIKNDIADNIGVRKARILGIFAAEGGLTGESIRFTNTDREIIDIIRDDLYQEFNLKLSTRGITHSVKNAEDILNVRELILKRLDDLGMTKNVFGKNLARARALKSGASLNKLLNTNDSKIVHLAHKQHARKILKQFLNDNGLLNKKSKEKRISNNIFMANRDTQAAFIGMVWSGDGYISLKKSEISIGLASELFIDDIQSLLLTFGILSTKRYKKIRDRFDSWVLTLNGNFDNIDIFNRLIGNHIIGPKRNKLKELFNRISKNSNTNIDIIPNNLYYNIITNMPNFVVKNKGLNLCRSQLRDSNLSRAKLKKYADYSNNEYLQMLSESDIIWRKITKIEYYGEDDTFDIQIENKTHLYALDGFITHNSAILESIRWALFDKSRHKKKDGVVKQEATSCKVVFVFEIDYNTYRITRQRNKVINQSDVTLEQWNGSEFEAIDCDTNTATDNKIINIVNFNHDVFVNSVYFKQGDISIFTESTPSKRKDILKALLKLDKWDLYQKYAKKAYSKLSTQLTEKQKHAVPIEEIEDELEEIEDTISSLKKDIATKNKRFRELSAQVVTQKSEYQMVSGDTVGKQQLAALQKEYADAKRKLNKIKRTVSANDEIIQGRSSLIQKANEKLILIEDKIKAKKGLDVPQKKAKLLEGKAQEKLMREQLSELRKNIRLEKECGSCLRPIKSAAEAKQIKSLREKKFSDLQERHALLAKKLKSSDARLKALETIVEQGNKAEIDKSKIKVKISSLEGERNRALEENAQFQKDKKRIESVDYASRIDELKDKFDEEYITNLQVEISAAESELTSLKRSIDKTNVEYGSKVSHRNELLTKKEEQEVLCDEIQDIHNELVVYDKLRHCFGKDGIQSIIIENVVDELENYTNMTLAKICNEPTSISIQMQRQSDSGSWTETFDIEVHSGSRQDEFEAFSGGEKFRISLALRLALSKILSKRMGGVVKFLLLDEVSSSLDSKGLNMFADIIRQLSSEMKILIITHDDRLKDKFDDVIVVEKTATGSRANN